MSKNNRESNYKYKNSWFEFTDDGEFEQEHLDKIDKKQLRKKAREQEKFINDMMNNEDDFFKKKK